MKATLPTDFKVAYVWGKELEVKLPADILDRKYPNGWKLTKEN